jgi:hypothetical protein
MRNTKSLANVCPMSAQCLANVPYVCPMSHMSSKCPQILPNVIRGQISDFFRYVFRKSQTFGLGPTNWAENDWGIWSIFGRKTKPYIQIPNIHLGLGFEFEFGPQRIRDLGIVSP